MVGTDSSAGNYSIGDHTRCCLCEYDLSCIDPGDGANTNGWYVKSTGSERSAGAIDIRLQWCEPDSKRFTLRKSSGSRHLFSSIQIQDHETESSRLLHGIRAGAMEYRNRVVFEFVCAGRGYDSVADTYCDHNEDKAN